MSRARDLINADLYPVLATFAVVYGAIQIAPIAQQARYFNTCVQYNAPLEPGDNSEVRAMWISKSVRLCTHLGQGRPSR